MGCNRKDVAKKLQGWNHHTTTTALNLSGIKLKCKTAQRIVDAFPTLIQLNIESTNFPVDLLLQMIAQSSSLRYINFAGNHYTPKAQLHVAQALLHSNVIAIHTDRFYLNAAEDTASFEYEIYDPLLPEDCALFVATSKNRPHVKLSKASVGTIGTRLLSTFILLDLYF